MICVWLLDSAKVDCVGLGYLACGLTLLLLLAVGVFPGC